MAPALVASVAEKALWTQLVDAKTAALPQRDDEDAGIAAFILAVLVPADVIPLILISLQREIVNLLPGQSAQLSLKGNYFWRSILERNHAD
jgi:hypothetical protein